MSENTLLRIDKLLLENYRCFSKCPVEFHPKLTVLVAENAGGKTAILDALRLALLPFVTGIGKAKSCPGFLRSDMRGYTHEAGISGEKTGFPIAAIPTSILAAGAIAGQPTQWRRERSERQLFGQTTRKDMDHVRRLARNLTERIYSESRDGGRGQQSPLPVVAYYGTGRLYSEPRLSKVKLWLAQSSNARMSAYLDCLSPSSSYKTFSTWFGQRWEDLGEGRSRAEGFQARPENQIAAVREAVKVVLEPTGWVSMDWQPADQDDDGRIYGNGFIRVENSTGEKVPLYTQSDGIRNMVALVGDLAHRCVRLNPHFGETAGRETSGIVMIDEVDMHLHPRWQQRVSVRTALQLINRFLAEDDFDHDTQSCLHWFEQHGWNESAFGEADTLARAKGTSVEGVKEAGIIESGGGKVRLLKWSEYPADWDPRTDNRLPVWEALHHLIRAFRQGGDSASGALLAGLGGKAEAVRQLAYRLYTLCERLGQAEDARAYNELITSWTGIESAAATAPQAAKQGEMFQ